MIEVRENYVTSRASSDPREPEESLILGLKSFVFSDAVVQVKDSNQFA